MNIDPAQFIWPEKYRPKTLAECILPKKLRTVFEKYIKQDNIPNLLLVSREAGTGKSTTAKALCNDLGCEYLFINGSNEGNIDTLRDSMTSFATSTSFNGKRKIIIVDEADNLNQNSTQKALRAFIEEYAQNCGFIFTCNYEEKLIQPLVSRLSRINYVFDKSEKSSIMTQYAKASFSMLDSEGIAYDKKAIAKLIQLNYPDFRQIIIKLQDLSVSGDITLDSVANTETTQQLLQYVQQKKFNPLRQYIAETDIDFIQFMSEMYTRIDSVVEKSSIPYVIDILYRKQVEYPQTINKDIFMCHLCLELMTNTKIIFK